MLTVIGYIIGYIIVIGLLILMIGAILGLFALSKEADKPLTITYDIKIPDIKFHVISDDSDKSEKGKNE